MFLRQDFEEVLGAGMHVPIGMGSDDFAKVFGRFGWIGSFVEVDLAKGHEGVVGQPMLRKEPGGLLVIGDGLVQIQPILESVVHLRVDSAEDEKTGRGDIRLGVGEIDAPEIACSFEPVLPGGRETAVALQLVIEKFGLVIKPGCRRGGVFAVVCKLGHCRKRRQQGPEEQKKYRKTHYYP